MKSSEIIFKPRPLVAWKRSLIFYHDMSMAQWTYGPWPSIILDCLKSGGAQWLSQWLSSVRLTIEWSRVRILLRPFGNFGNFLYPTLPVSFGGDTKSRWSLLSCVYHDSRCHRKGNGTFRPRSVSAILFGRNVPVFRAKKYGRFGQEIWTFRPRNMDVSAKIIVIIASDSARFCKSNVEVPCYCTA